MASDAPSAKPFDASFGAGARYTAPQGDAARTRVRVAGTVRDGEILGRNGPRVQVRFQLDGSSYVRWFDAADLLPEATGA